MNKQDLINWLESHIKSFDEQIVQSQYQPFGGYESYKSGAVSILRTLLSAVHRGVFDIVPGESPVFTRIEAN